jgi:glycosyltransferase 2 family protein
MPGGLGGAELAMTGLLSLNNVPLADAIAASLVIRLATLWFAVLLGGLALALGKQNIAATGGNKHS